MSTPIQPIISLTRLSDVEPESVAWLWPGRIPLGKLSIIVGDPCVGKSFIIYGMAAAISTGAPWPDRPDDTNEVGNIILLTAEDGLADTVRPRIDAAGGDPSRIVALTAVRYSDEDRPGMFRLDRDIPALEAAIESTSARLVTIDPLSAYLGGADSYRDSEVRGLLAPLAELAERRRVAIVGVMHLGKDSSRKAMYRGNGSIAFTAAPRAVWAVGLDRDDEERRIMACVKMNLAEPAPGIAYRIRNGVIEWDPVPVETRADALLGPADDPSDKEERDEAEQFLRELLADGDVPAKKVFSAGHGQGQSAYAIRAAGKRLGIEHVKAGRERWDWRLPAQDAENAKMLNISNIPICESSTPSTPSKPPAGDNGDDWPRRRLLQLADACEATSPDRAAELRAEAERIR